jgi:hypothetical protein
MAPKSPTDMEQPDTRLSTLIDEARNARDRKHYVDWRDRALVDREFSHISTAIEEGLRTVVPGSADATVLKRLQDAVRQR